MTNRELTPFKLHREIRTVGMRSILLRTNENFENVSLEDEMTFEHSNRDRNANQENQSNNSEILYTTRSGRTVRPPIRYKYYVR